MASETLEEHEARMEYQEEARTEKWLDAVYVKEDACMFDLSPDEFRGAMHFCEYLRGKVDAKQLVIAWQDYHASVMAAWKPKEEKAS